MSDRLAQLEAQIEQFVEGTLTRLLAGRLQAREVAVRLARAMEDQAQPGPREIRLAPTHYHVRINPADEAALRKSSPDLIDSLTAELVVFARELGLALPGQPSIRIEPDPNIEPHEVVVVATASHLLSETRPVPIVTRSSANPSRAFLIINGDRHVPLNKAVITLGRKLDNTIILDDTQISRHHAQLRQRYGRWILYDLGSASGTYVNNHKIDECLLQPGDVISLSGVTLIYAEEELTGADGDTGGTLPVRAESEPPKPKEVSD